MNVKTFLTYPIPAWQFLAGLGVAAGGTAVGVSYFMRSRMSKEFDERIEKETEAIRQFYGAIKKPNPIDMLEAISDDLAEEIIERERYGNPQDTDTTDVAVLITRAHDEPGEESYEVEEHNVFTDSDEWDQEAEMESRDPAFPYVISQAEFAEKDEHEVETITYYDGDGALADSRDVLIPDIDGVVGEQNMRKFGHGSNDPNIVYIRNERLQMDYEVVLSENKFTEVVLGYLQHEDEPPRRRPIRYAVYDD